jgi:predicted nucleotidyltransferase
MKRAEALKKLRTFAGALRARGATSLYLFGSTAKNKAGANSDLDLFLDYDPRGRFNAFDLVASKRLLQEGLGVDVSFASGLKLRPSGFFDGDAVSATSHSRHA